MYWNSAPPWMQGMRGMGGGQQMTPGAGMPPYRNAPMNMNPIQMNPPTTLPGAAPPPVAQQGQGAMNPAQMGMLSQMLAQQTRQPTVADMSSTASNMAQGATQGAQGGMAGLDPNQIGMLRMALGLFA